MVSSKLSKDLSILPDNLTTAERENAQITRKNQELAKTMLKLAEEAKPQDVKDIENPAIRDQIHDLDAQIRAARRDWRIMKSVVSSVIAGSGINWAHDEKLTELVLDDEDEMG